MLIQLAVAGAITGLCFAQLLQLTGRAIAHQNGPVEVLWICLSATGACLGVDLLFGTWGKRK